MEQKLDICLLNKKLSKQNFSRIINSLSLESLSFCPNSDHVLSRETDNRYWPLWENASCVIVRECDSNLQMIRQVATSQRIMTACSGLAACKQKNKI